MTKALVICEQSLRIRKGASVSLFIDLLRWRDACRGRDSLAALMGAGMLLINNGLGWRYHRAYKGA